MPIHPMLLAPLCRVWLDFQTVRHLARLRVHPVACPEIATEAVCIYIEAMSRLPPPLRWLARRTALPDHR
jgi:hypothetical protein